MTTNLLILYPNLTFDANTQYDFDADIFFNTSCAWDATAAQSVTGAKRHGTRSATTTANLYIGYDVSGGVSGLQSKPTHCVIARADLMVKAVGSGTTRVEILGSDSSVFASGYSLSQQISAGGLMGPTSEDYVFACGGSTNYRYWRYGQSITSLINQEVGKVFLCSAMDMGREPGYPCQETIDLSAAFARRNRRRFSLTWDGVVNLTKQQFEDYVYKQRDVKTVFLYDTNNYLFHGDKLVYCELTNCSFNQLNASNWQITAEFEEVI